jgi:hypothetical protein
VWKPYRNGGFSKVPGWPSNASSVAIPGEALVMIRYLRIQRGKVQNPKYPQTNKFDIPTLKTLIVKISGFRCNIYSA